MMRWWLVLVVGCYAPTASPGAPCSATGRCPAGLDCEAGRCIIPGPATADAAGDTSTPSDAPPADSSSMTCPGMFCDGFESPNLGDVWTIEGGVSKGAPRTGAASLEAAITSQTPYAYAAVRPFGSPHGSELFARAWLYVPATATIDHLDLLVFWSEVSGGIAVHGYAGGLHVWNANVQDGSYGAPIPRDAWFCVELHVTVSSSAGLIEVSLDGQKIITRSNESTAATGGYGGLSVGIPWANTSQPPISLRVDDVVAGAQPIGCD